MKNLSLQILFLLVSLTSFSQENFSRSDKSEYADADFLFYQERYAESIETLKYLHKKYPESAEVAFKLGVSNLELNGDLEWSRQLLRFALQREEKEALIHLGRLAHLNYEFDEALKFFNEYSSLSKKQTKYSDIQRLINTSKEAKRLTQFPEDVLVKNLGAEINSPYSEYIPLITQDENEIYFTSRRDNSTGGKKDQNEEYFEDIYYTSKSENGWNKPTNNLSDINTSTHDATAAISTDGNSMVIYRTNKQLTGGDLYLTNKIKGTWSEPKLLDERINTDYQEASACFSPDGKSIYFSSNRPGGYGGKDIYRVRELPNGEWSLPKNLGPVVNTDLDEDAPFLDVDNRTLYFASKGHASMGGFDIFTSKREGAEHWTAPENLGFPANSVGDDIYLSLTPGGRKGYYSSEKEEGYGNQDLYEIEFIYRQQTNLIIKGSLEDDHGLPLKGEITIIDQNNKELQGVYNSNEKTGKYLLILHPLTNYKVMINVEGNEIITREMYFDFPEKNNSEINLEKIIVG